MAAMLAERLGVPQVSLASKVEVDGTALRIHRQQDYGYDKVEASLPAVISVVEKINEPRYPSFKGIMAAKKKPVETLTLADTGIDAGQVGLAAAATEVVSFAKPAAAAGGHGRQGRGRRRDQGGRVPRRAEVHLSLRSAEHARSSEHGRKDGRPWLRSWSSPSTTARR